MFKRNIIRFPIGKEAKQFRERKKNGQHYQ